MGFKFSKKLLASVMIFSLALGAVGSVHANEVSVSDESSTNEEVVQEKELTEVLSAIEIMPDSVIEQGDEAIVKFIDENTSDDIEVVQDGDVIAFGAVGCASAIGTAIITNVIPFAKIAKVKTAIKAAGGATTFAKTLISTYKSARSAGATKGAAVKKGVQEAGKASAPEVQRALLEFFNVGNVYSACFE
jgi:hypothetical protein